MAFWGVEVKAGNRYTHKFDESKGRLHVSMASLGLGDSLAKSVLQCNVGNKSPVILCCLDSKGSQSMQVNLEFEEVDDVIFSVIGPRSIHLSGYFLGGSRNRCLIEESESYGEDIANSESHGSECSDDDEYEDSFIHDGTPEISSPSPLARTEEEYPKKKLQHGKGNRKRRLFKAYQLTGSDSEECSSLKKKIDGDSGLASEDEGGNDDVEIDRLIKNKLSDQPVATVPQTEVGHENVEKQTKKRKERNQTEVKADIDTSSEDEKTPKLAYDINSAQVGDEKRKKKRKKELVNEEKASDIEDSQSEKKKSKEKKAGKKKKSKKVGENGLVIEVLESGKPEGKVAASGDKISIRYVGKLKDTGEVIGSNIDRVLLKFRLGSGKVIKGLEVGVEGTRVGDKRRITVPPTMGYGTEGNGKNIPPESWLVYEVEVVKLR